MSWLSTSPEPTTCRIDGFALASSPCPQVLIRGRLLLNHLGYHDPFCVRQKHQQRLLLTRPSCRDHLPVHRLVLHQADNWPGGCSHHKASVNKGPAEETGCLVLRRGIAGEYLVVHTPGRRIGPVHLGRGRLVRLRSLVVRWGLGMVLGHAENRMGDRIDHIAVIDHTAVAGRNVVAVVVGSLVVVVAVGSLHRMKLEHHSPVQMPERRIAGFRTGRMGWTL